MNIVDNIKEIRLNKGIGQKLLADALNVDTAVISNIETGKRELKVSELEIISSCLGVEVIDLFTYPHKYVNRDTLLADGEPVEAILQIKLGRDKKEQVLKVVFGDNNLEILNK
ncbi:helix-turn-helix domain-containing protein [Bacteroides pyogenes]|uniref:helix-turn-helix domain-containing protein n=1 Tax=Bacteroides pyogenes TaxID=310300 RepID=UPI00242F2EA7|nr:helix-turn-helix transcriptional regulator [Bacteroides pyogenes]